MIFWPQEFCFDKLQQFEKLICDVRSANEDTTRLRSIDTILFDVLGWNKSFVETEKYCRCTGFADYVFLEAIR